MCRVGVLVLCSYITLPLYALIAQVSIISIFSNLFYVKKGKYNFVRLLSVYVYFFWLICKRADGITHEKNNL